MTDAAQATPATVPPAPSNGNGLASTFRQIVATVATAAVIGLGGGYVVLRTDVAVLQAEMRNVNTTLTEIKTLMQAEYAARRAPVPAQGAPTP